MEAIEGFSATEYRFRKANGQYAYVQDRAHIIYGKGGRHNLNQILGAAKMYIELAKTDEQNREMCLNKSSGYLMIVIVILQEDKGVGMMNIKSRAESHNGKVTIASIPGKGFELKVELPLNSCETQEV